MVNQVPEHIDPFKLSRQGKSFSGDFNVSDMPRLTASLVDDSGIVSYRLDFSRIDQATIATGQFCTEVKMECQRCLNQVVVPVQGEVHLEFVVGEETEGQLEDQGFETVTVEDESFSVIALIEDEVLLSLPFSPLHEKGECPGSTIVEKLQETSRPNPFAVLAKLKNDQEL